MNKQKVFIDFILLRLGVAAGGCPKRCNDIKVAPKRDFHSWSVRCVIPLHRIAGSSFHTHILSHHMEYKVDEKGNNFVKKGRFRALGPNVKGIRV